MFEPLPGVAYHSTMQTSDIYPAVVGIGGVRTQDYTIPVFADHVVASSSNAAAMAQTAGPGLLSTPAGWMVVLLIAFAAVAFYHAEH